MAFVYKRAGKSSLERTVSHSCLSPECGHTRRQFIASVGAAAAASVTLPPAPLVAQPAPANPRRIDVHHHCYPKAWFERHKSLLLGSDSNPDEIKNWSPQQNIDA